MFDRSTLLRRTLPCATLPYRGDLMRVLVPLFSPILIREFASVNVLSLSVEIEDLIR